MYKSKRKVKSNGKTVVGQISSIKRTEVQFESALEEGFLYILHFDREVTCFHDQPVQIEYRDKEGVSRIYTPDFLVEYKNRKPALFEVKSSHFLEKNKQELNRLFKAANKFAIKRSWTFNVVTDKEINTVYCDNVRFLYRFQTYCSDLIIINNIITTLSKCGTSTPNLLIKQITSETDQWPIFIAAIWTLILNKQIGCNLFEKIDMETPIWIPTIGGSDVKELKYPYLPC